MRCGISTASFYPENTLESLRQVIETGAGVTEIFLNTFSEAQLPYVAGLLELVRGSGIRVASVHPFTSAMEGFFFATPYEGRLLDGLDLYRRYFEICAELGAGKLVFHGDHKLNPGGYSDEKYAANFRRLAEMGREYGVILCHENVVYCRLCDPQRVRELRPLLADSAAFVLDTKQLHRAGAPLDEMLAAMGGDIRHVHISDFTAEKDCIPPGEGGFDLCALLRGLKAVGYEGDMVIELYRDGYDQPGQLVQAMAHVNRLIDTIWK